MLTVFICYFLSTFVISIIFELFILVFEKKTTVTLNLLLKSGLMGPFFPLMIVFLLLYPFLLLILHFLEATHNFIQRKFIQNNKEKP